MVFARGNHGKCNLEAIPRTLSSERTEILPVYRGHEPSQVLLKKLVENIRG